LFVPSSREYAVPWIVGLAAIPILASLGSSAVQQVKVPQLISSSWLAAGAVLVLLAFDSAVLWTNIRPLFLTWRLARTTFLFTLASLVGVYWAAWGAALAMRGVAPLALVNDTPVNLRATLMTFGAALTGLAPSLLVSALWKFEDPSLSTVRLTRAKVLALAERAQRAAIDETEFTQLRSALDTFLKDCPSAEARLTPEAGSLVLRKWAEGAGGLKKAFDGIAVSDLPRFGNTAAVRNAIAEIRRVD
jgi:hypothetical protein